jgi:Bacterial dipeptidyl-peptidase Sh3 domain
MALRPTGQSSAKPQPTPTTAEEFALSGPSHPPDPEFHAYRKDLADVALAGRVIASHYAEPLARTIALQTTLREAPSDEARAICELAPGDSFALLDDSLGWAWGYAGKDRRVGYVTSGVLGPA